MSVSRPTTGGSRRRYPRTELDHPAILLYRGHRQPRCRIRNFSEGGLYLEGLEPESPAAARFTDPASPDHDEAVLEIPARQPGQPPLFSVPVRIVYRAASGLGVAFLRKDRDLLDYLRSRPALHSLQPPTPGSRSEGKDHARLTGALRQITRNFLASRLDAFLALAQDNLLERANGAVDNQQESDLLYALSVMEKEGSAIGDTLMMQLELGIEGKEPILDPSSGTVWRQHDKGEMDLVDKEEFDEWVMVVSLARASEARVYPSLNSLQRSLALLSSRTLDSETNPVSPHYFLWALRNAISEFEFSISAKQVLFHTFSSSIIDDIQLLYDQLLDHLSRNGGLPPEQQPAGFVAPAAPIRPVPEAVAAAARPDRESLKKDSLTTLAAIESISTGQRRGYAVHPGSPVTTASRQAILQTLESLLLQRGSSVIERVEAQLEQRSVDGRPVALEPEIRQAIRATEQVISDLNHNGQPCPEMQQLIERLQIPLIRAVVQDPALLNDPGHPMRELLETIDRLSPYTQGGRGHGSGAGAGLDDLLQQIETIAERGRPEDILGATRKAKALLTEQVRNFERNVEIVVRSSRQEEALRRRWRRTLHELQTLLQGKSVSRCVDRLLRCGWPGLLLQDDDQEAAGGRRHRLYIKVIKFLLKTFKEKARPRVLDESQVEPIVRILQRGFRDYPVHAEASAELVKELTHAFSSGGEAFQALVDDRVPIDADYLQQRLREQAPITIPAIEEPPAEGPWTTLLRDMDAGEWIVEHRDRGQVRLLNLAWKNEAASRFVFVDGEGRKALDATLAELADHFERSRYALLENRRLPLVERSVDHMLQDRFEQIRRDTGADELTGLMNRKSFQREIDRLIRSAKAEQTEHVLILLDIDQFALINDLCGFDGGDQLLKTVTNILSTYLSSDGLISRTGDDEFGILLQGASLDRGYQMAETQRRVLESFKFEWQSQTIPITVSSGIVAIDGRKGNPAELLKDASNACTIAKQSGRNCSRIFKPQEQEFRNQQRLIQSVPLIEQALTKNRLCLNGQLITPLFAGEGVEHYEILIRVLDREGRPTNPIDFIEAAERYDRMRSVDRWVIETFFAWVDRNRDRLADIGGFTLNLSGQSVVDPQFGEFLKQKIEDCPLPAKRLAFEITETALVTDMESAVRFIDNLRATGCSFYLDDFGSGYASYSYLKDLPVDTIKIDGVFIKDMLEQRSSRAMVKSITEIAHYMGKKVVAEFVENEALIRVLRELGVDFAQGYGIARPLPLDQILPPQAAACG